ncbi:MAG: glycosyltransferase [Chloroflexi bacterium]|nr:MAG: glycosyltransferase [Chloroflexota bacterium]
MAQLLGPERRLSGWQQKLENWLDKRIPPDVHLRHELKVRVFRVIALADVILGLYYFYFRYTRSLNLHALWFSIPLLLAETYSFVDTLLFILMMWRPRLRIPPPPPPGLKVDVFITTYSEPVELVRETAVAALNICYPHNTYVLDDGNRPEMRAMCEEIGCGYITRMPEWEDKPRHAKAGNVNNALFYLMQQQKAGDFVLILDADQIPYPHLLDRTLGYFNDPKVAFVQTPQWFYNVPLGDPFGSQAPLFYGPIQQGKDGWDAAFFCGSNAILRREALMQLGLVTYVSETEQKLKEVLSKLPIEVLAKQRRLPAHYRKVAKQVMRAAESAVSALRRGEPWAFVLDRFNATIQTIRQELIAADLSTIAQELAELQMIEKTSENGRIDTDVAEVRQVIEQGLMQLTNQLAEVAAPPVEILGIDEEKWRTLNLDLGEALDVQPLATFSITEDMATAMRLHALGWKSVFHNEVLVRGLAPEDLGSALGQRLRWAAGTIQVLLHENPLFKKGLSWPQRLQYFTTMYSYFSGFASLIYLIAPIIYLFFGISPVVSFAGDFLWRIIPYLLLNKIMFTFVAWGIEVFRGEQYNLALFPLWIQAVMTVLAGEKLKFNITPKTRQSGVYLNLVKPQLTITVLLTIGVVYALFGLLVGWRNDVIGVLVNIFWAGYDIFMLSVILKAAVYRWPDA